MNSKSPSRWKLSVFQRVISLQNPFISCLNHFIIRGNCYWTRWLRLLLSDKWKGNETFQHQFPLHLCPASLAAVKSLDWFPQGHNSRPIINNPALGRSCQARRAAERSRTRALRFDPLLSTTSFSIFPSPLHQYMFEFHLRALASITRIYHERGFGVNEQGRNVEKQ